MTLNLFNFPSKCYVNQRVPKTAFTENESISAIESKFFQTEVDTLFCTYVLNNNVLLMKNVEEEFEYLDFAVFEITLRHERNVKRLAELCHRMMPSPLLIIFRTPNDKVIFSMAKKRFSKTNPNTAVVMELILTASYTEEALSEFNALADFSRFKQNDFRSLHEHYFQRLEALNCAHITGHLCALNMDPSVRRQYLVQYHALTNQLSALKNQAVKEDQLPRKVELNMQAKKIEDEINNIKNKLKQNENEVL